MALDVGDSRIGVALSDPLGIMASPLTIITRRDIEKDIEAILSIVRERDVTDIIVGLPLSMDGSQGVQAEKTRDFAAALARRTEVPLHFQDERLSTVEAARLFRQAGKSGPGTRYDAAAAAVILQSYLDANAGSV
jgi:putative Holliday junction resolvase